MGIFLSTHSAFGSIAIDIDIKIGVVAVSDPFAFLTSFLFSRSSLSILCVAFTLFFLSTLLLLCPGTTGISLFTNSAYGLNAADTGIDISIVAVSDPFADEALHMFKTLDAIFTTARYQALVTGGKQKIAFYVVPSVELAHHVHTHIVGNGNIVIKALLGSSTVDFRIRTIHVWDKTSSRYGADQCFERIIPWLEVDSFAKSRSACAPDALVETDKSWGSFLSRHLALSDDRINFESPLRCPLHTAAHVGRRFTNLASSLHMIINFPNAQVTDLTIRRSAEIRLQSVGAGTKRDSVAQVGNAFLQGGVEGGLILAKSQFICLERIQTWGYLDANFKRMRVQRLDTGSRVVVRDFAAVQTLEKLLGYVFVDKRLLLEALSHRNTPPNYERLQFLGDAVLGLVAAAYWARRYPKDQTKATMNLAILSVCNATLGMLCLETGLYQHIRHATATNPHEAAFASVRVRMQDARRNALDPDGAYWLQCKIPKVLADVMESVFGAVFLDSGCQFAPVCELFMRLMEPTLRKHLTDDTGGNDHSARRSS